MGFLDGRISLDVSYSYSLFLFGLSMMDDDLFISIASYVSLIYQIYTVLPWFSGYMK